MSECMILRPKFAPPTKQVARPTTAPANPVASRAENYNRKNGTSEYIPDYRLQKKHIPPPSLDKYETRHGKGMVDVNHLHSDSARAGIKSSLVAPERKTGKKSGFEPPAEIKEKPPQAVRRSAPPEPKEDTKYFDRKKRTTGPTTTEAMNNTTTLKSGGIFPEDAKPGVRYKTDSRPRDNADVITYEYSGGLCPPKGNSALSSSSLKSERAQYERGIRDSIQNDHITNKGMYNYFRARRTSSSLAFTDFLYDKK